MKDEGLTFDKFIEAKREAISRDPVVVAIWFVDSDAEYSRFMNYFKTVSVAEARLARFASYPGIPAHQFRKSDFDPDEDLIDSPSRDGGSMFTDEYKSQFKRVWPWVCAFRGVWAQMNNGMFERVKIGDYL
jgi:hypothetical protein